MGNFEINSLNLLIGWAIVPKCGANMEVCPRGEVQKVLASTSFLLAISTSNLLALKKSAPNSGLLTWATTNFQWWIPELKCRVSFLVPKDWILLPLAASRKVQILLFCFPLLSQVPHWPLLRYPPRSVFLSPYPVWKLGSLLGQPLLPLLVAGLVFYWPRTKVLTFLGFLPPFPVIKTVFWLEGRLGGWCHLLGRDRVYF